MSHLYAHLYGLRRHIRMFPAWITPTYLYVHLYGSRRHISMFPRMDHIVTFVCSLVWITTSHLYVPLYG